MQLLEMVISRLISNPVPFLVHVLRECRRKDSHPESLLCLLDVVLPPDLFLRYKSWLQRTSLLLHATEPTKDANHGGVMYALISIKRTKQEHNINSSQFRLNCDFPKTVCKLLVAVDCSVLSKSSNHREDTSKGNFDIFANAVVLVKTTILFCYNRWIKFVPAHDLYYV